MNGRPGNHILVVLRCADLHRVDHDRKRKLTHPPEAESRHMADIIRNNHVANCATGFKTTSKAERSTRPDVCDFAAVERHLKDRAWFLARTKPGQEFEVVWRLLERRFLAATPVEQRWRFWNDKHKDKTRRDFPGLPGYVAIAQPLDHRARRWVGVITCEGITGILGEDLTGYPYQLRPTDVLKFTHELSSHAPDQAAFMATGGEFSEGDDVIVGDPSHPLSGSVGKALKVAGDRTTVFIEFLGTLREVSVPTRSLESLAS